MLFGRDSVATELDIETWRQCLDINLTGMFLRFKRLSYPWLYVGVRH